MNQLIKIHSFFILIIDFIIMLVTKIVIINIQTANISL